MYRFALSFRPMLVVFALCLVGAVAMAESKPDQNQEFELAPGKSSELYRRPDGAEYFWWDIEPPIDVELTFEDGTSSRVGSEKEFSKKIVSVKFINSQSVVVRIKLFARFY